MACAERAKWTFAKLFSDLILSFHSTLPRAFKRGSALAPGDLARAIYAGCGRFLHLPDSSQCPSLMVRPRYASHERTLTRVLDPHRLHVDVKVSARYHAALTKHAAWRNVSVHTASRLLASLDEVAEADAKCSTCSRENSLCATYLDVARCHNELSRLAAVFRLNDNGWLAAQRAHAPQSAAASRLVSLLGFCDDGEAHALLFACPALANTPSEQLFASVVKIRSLLPPPADLVNVCCVCPWLLALPTDGWSDAFVEEALEVTSVAPHLPASSHDTLVMSLLRCSWDKWAFQWRGSNIDGAPSPARQRSPLTLYP